MGTVTKALSLLTFFSPDRTEIGLSELARLSGVNKATVYRLMCEMQAAGFVEQAGGERAYRLGSEVMRLAALRDAAVPLLAVSREVCAQLSAATGETAHMSQVQGKRLITLTYSYSTAHAARVMMEDAEVLAFHATGSGLAVLAFADPDLVDGVLGAPLQAFTARTCVDPTALRRVLDQVRTHGVAESIGGFEAEVHSQAAPIFGADQRPVGALAVAAPEGRVTTETRHNIRTQVRAHAQSLTRRIGGFAPAVYPAQEVS